MIIDVVGLDAGSTRMILSRDIRRRVSTWWIWSQDQRGCDGREIDVVSYRRGGSGRRVDAVDTDARYTASIIDAIDLDATSMVSMIVAVDLDAGST